MTNTKERMGHRWSNKEEWAMLFLLLLGAPIKEVAAKHERGEGAIYARLSHIFDCNIDDMPGSQSYRNRRIGMWSKSFSMSNLREFVGPELFSEIIHRYLFEYIVDGITVGLHGHYGIEVIDEKPQPKIGEGIKSAPRSQKHLQQSQAARLKASGYCKISNNKGIVARIDSIHWVATLARKMNLPPSSFTFINGDPKPSWADYYRRHYSKDRITLGEGHPIMKMMEASSDGPSVFITSIVNPKTFKAG